MRAKTFALVKEALAVGGHAAAVGGAQVAQVFQIHPKQGGRGLLAKEAHQIVARVRLGKQCILFRLGNDPVERAGAIEDLAFMLKKRDKPKVQFPMDLCRCIAAAAVDEMAVDMCPTCKGARQVPMATEIEGRQPMMPCPDCGDGKRRYREDERVTKLAREWVIVNGSKPEDVTGDAREIANELRGHPRLGELISLIEWGKSLIIESERVAVEETARMLERW